MSRILCIALATAIAGSAQAAGAPEDSAWTRQMDAWVQGQLDQADVVGDETGVVDVAARIDAQGGAQIVGVRRSSGCRDLDAEALADLTDIAHAPAAPSDLAGQTIIIKVNFRPPPEDLISRHAFWRRTCH